MTGTSGAERWHALEGRYDAQRAAELEAQLDELFAAGARTIVLDLSDVTYVSSSALRTLLIAHRRASRDGGQVVLTNIPQRIMRVLRMAGLDRVFGMRGT